MATKTKVPPSSPKTDTLTGAGSSLLPHDRTRGNKLAEIVFDGTVASAFLATSGDVAAALKVLKYPVDDMTDEQITLTGARLAEREGVWKIITASLEDINEAKVDVARRQLAVALAGDNGQSLQAAYFLGNLLGWMAPKKFEGKTATLNLHRIMTEQAALDAIDGLDHEPGEAIAIYSEARHDELQD